MITLIIKNVIPYRHYNVFLNQVLAIERYQNNDVTT